MVSDLPSLPQAMSLLLHFLFCVPLRKGMIEQLWWAPGNKPGSTRHTNLKVYLWHAAFRINWKHFTSRSVKPWVSSMTYSACSKILISRDWEIISHIYAMPSRVEAQSGRRASLGHSQIGKSVISKWQTQCWWCSVNSSTRWVKCSLLVAHRPQIRLCLRLFCRRFNIVKCWAKK